MRKRLSYVSPWQVGKVLGVLYALLSLLVVPFIFLISLLTPAPSNGNHSAIFFGSSIVLIILPVVYAVLGFVFGVIGAAIYNLVAKWTGGIEFIVTDVLSDGAPPTLPPSPYSPR